MALEGRCKRASRMAFKIGLHKFSSSPAHVPPPLCLTDYFAEGLEPDYRDRPSSITAPPEIRPTTWGPHGSRRLSVAGYTQERNEPAAQAAALAGYSRASSIRTPCSIMDWCRSKPSSFTAAAADGFRRGSGADHVLLVGYGAPRLPVAT
jgi:hypothetical protein